MSFSGSNRTRSRLVLILAVTWCVWWPTLALAQQSEPAPTCGEDPFRSGVEALGRNDYQHALTCFREALGRLDNPAVRYNIAACHDNLDQLPEARNELTLYLRDTDPSLITAGRRQQVEQRLAEIDVRVGLLEFEVTPAGATVTIDGHAVEGVAPFNVPWAVAPGAHRVEVSLAGHQTHTGPVSCIGGQRYPVAVTLEPLPGSLEIRVVDGAGATVDGATVTIDGTVRGTTPLEAPSEVAVGEHQVEVSLAGYVAYSGTVSVASGETRPWEVTLSEEEGGTPEVHVGGDTTTPERHRLTPAWFGVTLGLAGALAVGGVVTGALVYQRGDEFLDKALDCQDGNSQACRDSRANANEGEALGRACTGLFISSGVVAAAAFVMIFFTEWHREASGEASNVRFGLTPLGLGRASNSGSGFVLDASFQF